MTIEFRAKMWLYSGNGAWHFVTLPAAAAKKIREATPVRRGFGSVRVKARIGKSQWETSVFPDKASKSYLLPVKAAVRKAEKIAAGKTVQVQLGLA